MGLHFVHSIGELERDLRQIAVTFKPKAAVAVRDVAKDGYRAARRMASRSAGKHGPHYAPAFSVERLTPLKYEWGPDADHPGGQGGMSFERGSRNQPPHHDIAKGADLHGAHELARKMNDTLDHLFWP